ncbi:MAG: hypothetical protein NE330_12150 [Lentisphaeraceae bacterium]|nr:hypothetical protein [Lentisphaeraceae bacterium]
MLQETINIDGKEVDVSYSVENDLLTLILPTGEIKYTHLNGLKVETALGFHLVPYLNSLCKEI